MFSKQVMRIEKKISFSHFHLIQHQILRTYIIRNERPTVERITIEILEMKGLIPRSYQRGVFLKIISICTCNVVNVFQLPSDETESYFGARYSTDLFFSIFIGRMTVI